MLEFIKEVSAVLFKGTPTEVIIMDFTKASDQVNHSLLVHKLDQYGIQGSENKYLHPPKLRPEDSDLGVTLHMTTMTSNGKGTLTSVPRQTRCSTS